MENPLLSEVEAARYLSISQATLRRHVKSGMIPIVRVGRRTLYRRESLDAYIQAHEAYESPSSSKGSNSQGNSTSSGSKPPPSGKK